jgi:hypothetical protein
MGNGTGWMIDENLTEAEKIQIVLRSTKHLLKNLEMLTEIYSKFGTRETFMEFKKRVNETIEKGTYESFFHPDDQNENSGQ